VTDHPPITKRQLKRLREVKETRNNQKVADLLNQIGIASKNGENLMPHIINAVREYASIQEICDVWRDVFGRYTDPGYF